MQLQDKVIEETKEKKNAVEAYVYSMRNKLYDRLEPYVTEAEKSTLSSKLQQTEDWLYEDGEDETKGVYIAKLNELKKMGDPLEERLRQDQDRPAAIQSLLQTITSFREAALSKDPKYDHIEAADKEKVVEESIKAEEWLADKQAQQAAVPKTGTPVLLVEEIKKKQETLDRVARPIMTKPKPAPKPVEKEVKPTADAKAEDAGPQEVKKEDTATPMDTEGDTSKAGEVKAEPIETDE
jgi:heat shock protein 4